MIKDSPYYNKFLKEPWFYTTGAVLLAIFNIALFTINGKPWGGVTSTCHVGGSLDI